MARTLPPLNAMRAFEAAARHESFARAAAELHVAPAAVSRHVRDFEIWLGHALFERHPRGLRLTAAGRRLGAALTPLLDGLAAAVEAERPRAGRVTVTVEPVFAHRWLLRRLGDFRALHPEIDLVLEPTDRLVDFTEGTVDLGIRYGRGPWPGVEAELLVAVEIYPVASPALAARLPPEPTMADLRAFTLLHEDGELWARWQRATEGDGAPPPAGLMLHDTHLAIEAAALGQGIALGDSILDLDDRRSGRLVRLTRRAVGDHAYWLVSAARRRLPAPARLFRDWLRGVIDAAVAESGGLPIR
ncbi:LysR substrate-binding domain-containing protein [Zavarzinia compransoris]|uniref:LysR family transcriptional regulator n=1 Tax=Zavarzinia compransoris TaxID=1264899 RepID=A0A317E6E3_9PROT|nr:LysR substrate-binding domain-containing protein [Zavarzinia compransoris]PWR20595.1 LysR family transcriptional regulator [Zavarzinia compransoris]TDP43759.1 LysR family glycine cleavage system transcriptional activator [Zavarzinia compransoris]